MEAPACYEDAVDAIYGLSNKPLIQGEKWIKNFGDLSRCYLGGRGNGANIVFHAALRAMDYNLGPMEIRGLLFNQPLLVASKELKVRLKARIRLAIAGTRCVVGPITAKRGDRDHRFSNPILDGPHKIKISHYRDLGDWVLWGPNHRSSATICAIAGTKWSPRGDTI
ncbi:probable carboxylesterase 9 [Pistacia vera]|uniref:probable carboxylesterase 9 n=1 Tax=Pistacia vera TaxID=55513 RepID=UPI0012639130|nr:probable carboxylesterase 9 [Pistacia vera]